VSADFQTRYGWEANTGWKTSVSSTQGTDRGAWKALNKSVRVDTLDRWLTNNGAFDTITGVVTTEECFRIDFPYPVIVAAYSITPYFGTIQYPTEWTLEKLNVGGGFWDQVGALIVHTDWDESARTFVSADPTVYSNSWRLNFKKALPNTLGILSISEIVFNTQTLPIEPEPPVTPYALGALDSLDATAYSEAVGAYALRRLYTEYTGAQVQIRRLDASNALALIYFDNLGAPTKITVLGVEEPTPSIETFLNGAEARITHWFDQSGNGKHLEQATASLRPILKHDPSMCGYVVHFNAANVRLTTTNLFATSSVPSIHIVSKTRELTRLQNWLLQFTGGGGNRIWCIMPWTDTNWSWGSDNSSIMPLSSIPNRTVVGETAKMSAFTTPTGVGLVVNGVSQTTSVSVGLLPVDTSFSVGSNRGTTINHHVQHIIVYSAKQPDALTTSIFSRMDMSECPRESPQFTGYNTVFTDYNSKYGWDTNTLWQVRASHNDLSCYLSWKASNKVSDINNRWVSLTAGAASVRWWEIKYPEQFILTSFSIVYFAGTDDMNGLISEWDIQGSNTGTDDYITLQSYVNTFPNGHNTTYNFQLTTSTTPYMYWRININSTIADDLGLTGTKAVALHEVKFITKKTVA
jgi:hypothetical protein